MSYVKYTTDAFLLSSRPSGEADKMLSLYTKDFGKVSALAKGVRLSKSKLKTSLEASYFLSVSLVRGKESWRITDAQVKERILFPSENFNLFFKIIQLLKSLVQGEGANEDLFGSLLEMHKTLREENLDSEDLLSLECICVVRILNALGYGRDEIDWGISVSEPIGRSLLEQAGGKRKELVALINNSLNETHL